MTASIAHDVSSYSYYSTTELYENGIFRYSRAHKNNVIQIFTLSMSSAGEKSTGGLLRSLIE